jgi:hypothetical protein
MSNTGAAIPNHSQYRQLRQQNEENLLKNCFSTWGRTGPDIADGSDGADAK